MLWHLIIGTVLLGCEEALQVPKCENNGEPCIDSVYERCGDDDVVPKFTTMQIIENQMDYPWSFEEGTNRKTLCCGAQIEEPLLYDTACIEWIYYKDGEQHFGKSDEDYYDILTNGTRHMIESPESTDSAYSYLHISDIALTDAGIYMCRVTSSTLPPADGIGSALTLSKFLDPFVIDVYTARPVFEVSDAKHEASSFMQEIVDYGRKPYVVLEYKLKPLNPYKVLKLKVETDTSLLQYIDVRAEERLIVNTHGDKDYNPKRFSENFTASFFYEGEEATGISRTWNIAGYYQKKANTVYIPVKNEDDSVVQSQDMFLDEPYYFYVVGTCENFNWEVELGTGERHTLEFDPDGTLFEDKKTITQGTLSMIYSFVMDPDVVTGELTTRNVLLTATFTRTSATQHESSDVRLFVSCPGDSELAFGAVSIKGNPVLVVGDFNYKNCVDVIKSGNSEDVGRPKETRQSPCCSSVQNQYNAHLWLNGAPFPTDEMIAALHGAGDNSPPLSEKREWYQKFSGFYQCFVSGYLSKYKQSNPPYYSSTTERSFTMGFYEDEVMDEVQISTDNITAYLTRPGVNNTDVIRDVTPYAKLFRLNAKPTLLVLNGSCVNLTVTGTVYPFEDINYRRSKVERKGDKTCTKQPPVDQLSFRTYDMVDVLSNVFAGPVNGIREFRADLSDESAEMNLIGLEPVLGSPEMTYETSDDVVTITCRVRGYPIEKVVLFGPDKNEIVAWEEDSDKGYSTSGKASSICNETGCLVEITARAIENGDYNCTAYYDYPRPKLLSKKKPVHTQALTNNNFILLIIVVVAGIIMVVLVIWVICACRRKASNPRAKLWHVLCCYKDEYDKIKDTTTELKDRYLLTYSSLNPGVRLGGGHFGNVFRGYAFNLPDRVGERTEIAIKEVKPCADRSRREDDLREEKEIMMQLQNHRNVLRIYGYTDDPDPLSLVMELAEFGSLSELLLNARTIKGDGYLMPNEHKDNPIMAFDSAHIMDFGRQIADGMDYIARNKIVHRDLAARNVVVAGDEHEYVLKVCDFGLARMISQDGHYERRVGKEIPIKWTAPDSLDNNIYTDKSDVWSYGVTLWELVTLGGEPYPGMPHAEVRERLRTGYRLPKPISCNDDLYDMMYRCWMADPEERPSFTEILNQLTEYCQAPTEYLRLDDLYCQDLDLTLKLNSSSPNNHVGATATNSSSSRNSRNAGNLSREQSRESHGAAAVNDYTPDPAPENVNV